MNVFFDKQAHPEQRKEYDEENGKDYPARGRDAPLNARKKLAHAGRAAIVAGHVLRIGRCERSGTRWVQRVIRFHSGVRMSLIFVGLPGVRPRRTVFVTRLCARLTHEKLRSAESAKLTFGSVALAAILALDHSNIEGEFHELFNASYYGKVRKG